MFKSIGLYALGIATGALATMLLFPETEPVTSQPTTRSAPSTLTVSERVSSEIPATTELDGSPDAGPLTGASNIDSLTRDELALLAEDSRNSMMAAQQELRRRERVERLANQPPPDYPIALPPEFHWLAQNPNALHEITQSEDLDPTWSPIAEAQLRTFLNERPEILETYGSPTISCRTNYCEVAFVAYGLEGSLTEGASEQRFRDTFSDVYNQPWAEQLGLGGSTASIFGSGGENIPIAVDAHIEDGVTTFLWYLHRTED